jgi:hypothetical protein
LETIRAQVVVVALAVEDKTVIRGVQDLEVQQYTIQTLAAQ